jgi:hypothetical protein
MPVTNTRAHTDCRLAGQRKFEVEINKKVEVFKDTIKALGPEVEDIVRRETFDMMKEHLEDHR